MRCAVGAQVVYAYLVSYDLLRCLVIHVVLALLHVLAEPSPLRPSSSIPLDSLLLHLHFTMVLAPASRQSHSTPPYSFLFSVKRELMLILVISSHLVPFSAFLTSPDNNRAIVAMQ
jgi:hypothetical protein